ncbi:MAG: multinuclear nonheme iron-dependent oxidase, partial [Pyrinomonadaceae bacterium]
RGKRLIDAHANQTEAEIWNVFREVCARCDIKGAILERDENFPPFAEILEELDTARTLMKNPNLKKNSAV